MVKGWKMFAVAALLWLALLPGAAEAATYTFSAAGKTAYDKLLASAEADVRARLQNQYAELRALETKGDETDSRVLALHDRNELALKAVKARIKAIDSANIAKLDAQVKSAQAKYKPLFDSYTALNKRAEAARKLKNKDLNAALKLQTSIVQVTVQLARDDIRAKQDKLKQAKTAAAAKAGRAKAPLATIDDFKKRIQAEKRAASSAKTAGRTLWSSFNASAKKGNGKEASSHLGNVIKLAGQSNAAKQNQYTLEQKIADAIARAEALAAA